MKAAHTQYRRRQGEWHYTHALSANKIFPKRVLILSRLSFRQLMLAAFLLIAVVVNGTSLHALLSLERFAAHSRETARDAVLVTEDVQRLAQSTVIMERSARQFLVLNDPAFRQRFQEAWEEAQAILEGLADELPATFAPEFAAWSKQSAAAWDVLQLPRARRTNREAGLQEVFLQLAAINQRLELGSKREVERRNSELLVNLEQQRDVLTALVIGAILLAVTLALGFGAWLSRPLAQIERAIGQLGDNHFDTPVEIRGPADLRKLGGQLDWLRRRLADLENDKDRFLRHVSHELKTPLAAMREGVALLEDGVVGKLSDDQREIARLLRQNTAALQTQIEDLLRYNAAAFDAQHLKRQSVDLQQLLKQVIDAQRLQWQARGLRVEVEVQGKLMRLAADVDKLGIVFGNLLSNAVRFSPEQGLIRFVLSRASNQVRDHVYIDCIDQGPGIAPTDRARVFEPFYQGERQPPGARRGSGIGLSIVREYIEAHGGTVQLLPHEGGAHFRIGLLDEA